jgi:hypothetical protein
MNAISMQDTLNKIKQHMTELAPNRKQALFTQFLVEGYTAITLSSVPQIKFNDLMRAKLCLGTLITLYDDYADRPTQHNPVLLDVLYQLDFRNQVSISALSARDGKVVEFAKSLFLQIADVLSQQPYYHHFIEILTFDLKKFYSANQFSSFLTSNPYLSNSYENRLYAHHNMGMVIVAMMDLMASEKIVLSEVGAMREVFLLGQRLGRIFNIMATRNRELLDGDITGELALCKTEDDVETAVQKLRQEISDLRARIGELGAVVTTFSVREYLDGLAQVQVLHEKMEGII